MTLELKLSHIQGKAQVAAALSAVEQNPESPSVTALLDEAFANPKGIAIGITGPPGAGKSTLINVLIAEWRKAGLSVAVLAVDPSSKATKGALLGDRVRMRTDPEDQRHLCPLARRARSIGWPRRYRLPGDRSPARAL